MKTKSLVFLLLFSFCAQDTNIIIDDTNIIIEDAIDPYCNGSDFSEVSNLTFDDLTTLNVNIVQSSEWYKNLANAYYISGTYPYGFIEDKYKDTFFALITASFKNFECNFDAEVRISGDWKDHLDIDELISSMDVSLSNGNLFGIVKFKLLLPHTRYADNEIFTSTMFSHLGFVSPRTFYTNVNVNGFYEGKFIFQEKATKELIENHLFREGPILEINEKYHWNTSTGVPFQEDGNIFLNGKITNLNWSRRSKINEFISLVALEKLNSSIFSTSSGNLNYFELTDDTSKLFLFDVLAYGLDADHGKNNHNRKFYYDRISDSFEPIYYDGNSQILIREKDLEEFHFKDNYVNYEYLSFAAKELLSNIDKNLINMEQLYLDMKSKGASFNEKEFDLGIERFVKNLNYLSTLTEDSKVSKDKKKLRPDLNFNQFASIDDKLIFYDIDSDSYKICDSFVKNCYNKMNKILNIFDKDNDLIRNGNVLGFSTSLDYDHKKLNSYPVEGIQIYYSGKPSIYVEQESKVIQIKFFNENDRVLIKNSFLDGYDISLTGNSDLNSLTDSRYNENLLTGCLTFLDVKFNNVQILADTFVCEDAVNIMNSSGDISNVLIKNTKFDSLDIDFSDLNIHNINIENSSNDCLDISVSKIIITKAALNSCLDKAISTGEKSYVKIDDVVVQDSSFGIAVKDSSEVYVDRLEVINAEICTAIYRKKQEFGPSKLSVSKLVCTPTLKSYIQLGSEYEN